MSMITSQVEKLRKVAAQLREDYTFVGFGGAVNRDPTIFNAASQLESAADTIEYLRGVGVENTKLQAERDEWHRVAESKQDTIDHMRDAQKENQKLRDLVQMMYACKGECDECQWLNDGYACGYFMQQLGIEVE